MSAAPGEQRCHFLVQWRDSHAIQHGRTVTTWEEAAEFDAAVKAGKLPRDAPGRRTAVTFGTRHGGWRTKQATKRPSTADLYATELRSQVLPAFASMPLPGITRRDVQDWVNALAASGLAPAPRAWLCSTTRISAPSRASSIAANRPIPRDAPVNSTVFPVMLQSAAAP
jgi:hypothetical protein